MPTDDPTKRTIDALMAAPAMPPPSGIEFALGQLAGTSAATAEAVKAQGGKIDAMPDRISQALEPRFLRLESQGKAHEDRLDKLDNQWLRVSAVATAVTTAGGVIVTLFLKYGLPVLVPSIPGQHRPQ